MVPQRQKPQKRQGTEPAVPEAEGKDDRRGQGDMGPPQETDRQQADEILFQDTSQGRWEAPRPVEGQVTQTVEGGAFQK